MSRRGKRGLKARMRRECCISRWGSDCAVVVYRSDESREEVAVLRVGTQQGEAPEVRAAKMDPFETGAALH